MCFRWQSGGFLPFYRATNAPLADRVHCFRSGRISPHSALLAVM
jgi:hypothetical protein